MTQDRYEHARQNAKAWAEELIALHAKRQNPSEDRYDEESADGIEDRAREMPLSVQVRGPWHEPLGEPPANTEFEILLSTGGPALRIIGDLDVHGEPDSARLEMQDWGVPWLEANGLDIDYAALDEALTWFASLFYYGE